LELSLWVKAHPVDPSTISAEDVDYYALTLGRASNLNTDTEALHHIRDAFDGNAVLWNILDEAGERCGAMTTRVIQFETGYTVLTIQLCAVDPHIEQIPDEAIAHVLGQIEQAAFELGCDAVRIPGRAGKDWGKVAPGYVEVERIFDKVVRGRDDGQG
jgi:hypothetical protein